MPAIGRILCPLDFSPPSDRAVAYAIDLAQQLHAKIDFLHTWELPAYALPEGMMVFGPEVVASIEIEVMKKIDERVAAWPTKGLEITKHVEEGSASLHIVRAATHLGADLIIMGTHGRTGVAHLVMGSVAERVVRTSHVPVLTVPPERKHEPKI